MILKRRFNLLLYGAFCVISCAEKEATEQDIFLDVSERKKFFIGEGGLTPDPLYFVSLDSSRRKGVIFNQLAHSLDSIFFSADSAWVKEGVLMEMEGPYGVGTVFSFFTTEEHNVFMNPQQFFNQKIKTKEVSMKFMAEFGLFGEMKYPAVSVPTPKVSHEFYGLDKNSGIGYFVFENDKQINVMGYDSSLDSMFVLPVSLDSTQYFQLRFKVKWRNLIIGGNDEPQLSVVANRLIVSYPTFSDILVYDLESENQQIITSTSKSFPTRRIRHENYADEVDSGELLDELENSWQKQVSYGIIIYLEEPDKFVRVVKGEGGADSSYFLEVLDQNLQKVNEINLTEMNSDLSSDYLNSKYGLMFRAKDQPEEDVMYYYYVNLAQKK